MARITRYTIAGMLGALIAWGVMEPTALMSDHSESVGYVAIFVIGLVSGLLIGFLLGLAEGMSGLSPRDTVKSAITGGLIGAAGGVVGLTLGNNFYNLMLRVSGGEPTGQAMPSNLPPGTTMSGGPSFVVLFAADRARIRLGADRMYRHIPGHRDQFHEKM